MPPRVQFREPLTPDSYFKTPPFASQIMRTAGSPAPGQGAREYAPALLHPLPPKPPSPCDKDNEGISESGSPRPEGTGSGLGAPNSHLPPISSPVVSHRATADRRHSSDQRRLSDTGQLSLDSSSDSEQSLATGVTGITPRDGESLVQREMQCSKTKSRLAAPESLYAQQKSPISGQCQRDIADQDLKNPHNAINCLSPSRRPRLSRATVVNQGLSELPNIAVVVPQNFPYSNSEKMRVEACDDLEDMEIRSEASSDHAGPSTQKRHKQTHAPESLLKLRNYGSRRPKRDLPSRQSTAPSNRPRKTPRPDPVQQISKRVSRSEYFNSLLDTDSDSSSGHRSSQDSETVQRIPVHGYLELSVHASTMSLVIGGTFSGLGIIPSAESPCRDRNVTMDAHSATPARNDRRTQRSKRYRRRELFTEEEDEEIIALKKQGYTWKEMEQFFPHRKYTALQSRWSRCLRRTAWSNL
ncbi:hypothetical protein BJY01DRAFT_255095 [Aspergillus pseudoustus]|uniref:Myb-like domain-containing protein n=1 Tax=Aspergillus pseudoustus TaxID=1810923 RepID=A0ABR4IMY0_9EURO